MKDNRKHTWHPNTFGLLYGATTKTACNKRRATSTLVKPLETDCRECQDAVIASMHEQQSMYDAANELAKQEGYGSVSEWVSANRETRTREREAKLHICRTWPA